ncbi:hypothetical protein CSC71_14785 [Pseudoxanthomonas sangjuensis]|uniref:hypothetical protein n=1 Tax=Pseudoxanthomonas sangjuensis TaxID=1503750 RepID=UPI001391D923|nr:hypothetical protein [Pseudoxanthomonas sangjuensis]KAF1705962.1 hypothetical protein CSC71_14785 [Pseudoxanthomonas sangjuensis]
MSESSADPELISVLREIRDQQREAIQLQRENMAMYREQLARVDRINERAEAIQQRAGKAIRAVLWLAIPLLLLLILSMAWRQLG